MRCLLGYAPLNNMQMIGSSDVTIAELDGNVKGMARMHPPCAVRQASAWKEKVQYEAKLLLGYKETDLKSIEIS